MAVRPIDGNELYRIEKLLDTDIVRQDKVALNLLEQVLYDIQHVPTLTPPNEWVSVKDAMPPELKMVLVYCDGLYNGANGTALIVMEKRQSGAALRRTDMKRLTDKRLAIPPGQWQEVTREEARELKEIPVPPMRDLYYRLSQIEDILCDGGDEYDLDRLSLLCNQRMTMREEVSQRFSLTAKIPLDRLRELAEADREGRCVVLPRLEPGQGDPPGELGPQGSPGIAD